LRDKDNTEPITALKNADSLVKEILHAADINQDGKISYDGMYPCRLSYPRIVR
jgi:hypothetical protein